MKVVFVTGLLPTGHYSQYITSGLSTYKDIDLSVYTDMSPDNLKIKQCGRIVPIWSRTPKFIFEILKQLFRDKPDVVHFQHEFNMYGSIITAAIFPILVALTRLFGFKVVTTIHAAVFKKQINSDFIRTFNQDPARIKPTMLYFFFLYVYKTLSSFSHHLIVHTKLTKEVLVQDYGVNKQKISVIPATIPQKTNYSHHKDPYFFYFGYMARRKGLGFAIDGFQKYLKKNPNSLYKLILAGGVIKGQEDSLKEILAHIKRANLSGKIIYKGFIEEAEQDSLYQKATAIVIPAVLSMGSSGPLYHANSYGKCVLASKIGHYLEDIDDGKTGILVDNQDWDKAFEWVVNHKQAVARIEKNTVNKALDRSPVRTARKYINLYNKIP